MKITKPTLIIDKKKCIENIKIMSEKAQNNNVIFRPHFKTHQLLEVGEWFRKFGVSAITVSSVEMAIIFAGAGWEDITIAFPCNILEIEDINKLASKIKLNLLIESIETITFLIEKLENKVGVFIKIDVGASRTGILPDNIALINNIIELAKESENAEFKGFLAHTGQNYSAKTKENILENHFLAMGILHSLKEKFQNKNNELIISLGDTPSCSISDDFSNIDEIRPGNFVFYDLMQYKITSCSLNQIAVAVACPVVAIHNVRKQIVIYGGAVHFSKEYLIINGRKIFGYIVEFQNATWKIIHDCYLISLSQEHGIVECSTDFIARIRIGEIIGVLPVHSCLTVNLLKSNFQIL